MKIYGSLVLGAVALVTGCSTNEVVKVSKCEVLRTHHPVHSFVEGDRLRRFSNVLNQGLQNAAPSNTGKIDLKLDIETEESRLLYVTRNLAYTLKYNIEIGLPECSQLAVSNKKDVAALTVSGSLDYDTDGAEVIYDLNIVNQDGYSLKLSSN